MDTPYVAVAGTDEIAPGKFLKVVVDNQAYIVANVDGRFYAVEDNCSHEDYPLSYGCLDGDRIKCSLHGSRFSLKTGEPIRTYRLVVSEGRIWIDPTEPRQG